MCSIHHCLQQNVIHLWLYCRVLISWRSWINGAELWYDLHCTDKGRIDAGQRLLMSNKTLIWLWMWMANDKLSSLEHASNITWMSWWMFSGMTQDWLRVPHCVGLDLILRSAQNSTSTTESSCAKHFSHTWMHQFNRSIQQSLFKKSMWKQVLAMEQKLMERSGVSQSLSLFVKLAKCCQQEKERKSLLQHGPIYQISR